MKQYRNTTIQPSITSPGKTYWSVTSNSGDLVGRGYAPSEEQAFMDSRNFIKRNQNAVFS